MSPELKEKWEKFYKLLEEYIGYNDKAFREEKIGNTIFDKHNELLFDNEYLKKGEEIWNRLEKSREEYRKAFAEDIIEGAKGEERIRQNRETYKHRNNWILGN